MPRRASVSSDDQEPLEDKTAALLLHSKRSERLRKKQTKRDEKRDAIVNLTKLPTELLLECLKLSQPGDVLSFGCVNRRFRSLVRANANIIGDSIIRRRYTILAKCFPLPKLLANIEPSVQPLLVEEWWQSKLEIHKNYQHVQRPNERFVCSCLTCLMAWNNLGVAIDFAHWQHDLDMGEPLPAIQRGQSPEWNQELLRRHARFATAALSNSLWHARILEMHLDSTIRAIKRQTRNKGNKRKHVEMTEEDEKLGTDAFLTKPGPPSVEFVFRRDNYYMLYAISYVQRSCLLMLASEAYLPNRFWNKQEDSEDWTYIFAGQHKRDLEIIEQLARPKIEPAVAQP
jgi:hypothetical protein